MLYRLGIFIVLSLSLYSNAFAQDTATSNILAKPVDSVIANDTLSDSLSENSSIFSSFQPFDFEELKTNDSLRRVVRQRKILLDSLIESGNLPKDFIENNNLIDSFYGDTIYALTRDTTYENSDFTQIIRYNAKDSVNIFVVNKEISMFNESKVVYDDLEADGYEIDFHQESGDMYILPEIDSATGELVKRPRLVLDDKVYLNDSVITNIRSKKALSFNSNFIQGDMYVFTEKSKKINDIDVYGSHGWFTTCNYSDPHFSFRTGELKFRKDKVAVGNRTYITFEDSRLPIRLPFIFFPVSTKRAQGLLFPNLVTVDNQGFGLGLENGGYYVKPSDHFDVKLIGSIYSYGNWGAILSSDMKYNYLLSNSLKVTYNVRNSTFPGGLVRSGTNQYSIGWNFNLDPKLIPTQTFSVNANFTSSEFFSTDVNPTDPNANFNNTQTSSVSYSKNFKGTPFRVNASGNWTQNFITQTTNLTLPSINFNMNDIFPLQGISNNALSRYYEKLTIRYATQINTRANFNSDTASFDEIIDNYRWGIRHSPSISLPLPQIGVFRFTPGINLSLSTTDQRITRFYSPTADSVIEKVEKGFYTYGSYSFNFGVTTSIYGVANFPKRFFIRGIRQVINPSLSLSYAPETGKNTYYNYVTNAQGDVAEANYFSNAIYGPSSRDRAASLSFGINTNLEIKVRSRKDTTLGYKKVSLIDNFSIRGSYNLIHNGNPNQRQLSDLALSLVTSIGTKLSLNLNGTWTLYGYDEMGGNTETKLAFNSRSSQGRFSLGRLTNLNISTGTSFNISKEGKNFVRGYTSPYWLQTNYHPNELYLRELEQLKYIPGEYHDFGIKFSMNVQYSLSMREKFQSFEKGYKLEVANHSMNLGGDLALSENTQISYQSNLEIVDFFQDFNINSLRLGINKNLHCWVISINIIPVGRLRTLSFEIRPKSNILQDLKILRNRNFLSEN